MELSKITDVIIRETADKIINNGVSIIRAGNNGPYYNTDTDVRNRAHWCVIFSKYYSTTGDESMRRAVTMLADAILTSSFYNNNGVYKCREADKCDAMNGLIGPAWIIEGLIYAAKATGCEKYYERALEISQQNPFNLKLGLWNRTTPENKVISVDVTFNHQLWYAAALAMITDYKKNDRINGELDRFIARLGQNFSIRRSGRISHFTSNDEHGMISVFGRLYRDLKSDVAEAFGRPSMAYKENGYHTFNLYGFAILKEYYKGSEDFFEGREFKRALKYLASDEYYNSIVCPDRSLDCTRVKSKLDVKENIFAFAYNSPAFELDRIIRSFIKDDELAAKVGRISEKFKQLQIDETYDESARAFCRNTDDANTLTARIYEYMA